MSIERVKTQIRATKSLLQENKNKVALMRWYLMGLLDGAIGTYKEWRFIDKYYSIYWQPRHQPNLVSNYIQRRLT